MRRGGQQTFGSRYFCAKAEYSHSITIPEHFIMRRCTGKLSRTILMTRVLCIAFERLVARTTIRLTVIPADIPSARVLQYG